MTFTSAETGITIDNISSTGFRINSSGGAGGGATVTTSDNAPINLLMVTLVEI